MSTGGTGEEASAGLVALRLLLAAALVAALGLSVALARGKALQVDEVEHVHAAYNLVDGRMIYRDFWEGHNPLLYGLLAPWIDADDAVGSFRRARVVPFAALLATAAVAALVARRLAGEGAGWLAAGLVASHSTMVERGLEVRPDALLALATIGAFACETSRLPGLARSACAALALGLAFVATQKAGIACAGFAAYWAWRAVRERDLRRLLVPAAVGAAPTALLLVWLARHDAVAAYWRFNVADQIARVAGELRNAGEVFGPLPFLLHEARFNLLFTLLAAAALLAAALRLTRRRLVGAELGIALLAGLQFASLWLQPFPYPYLHVTVVPALAVLVATELRRLSGGWGGGRARELAAAIAIVLLAATTSAPRLASRLDGGLERQLAVLAEVQRLTAADDTVFDLAGLYFRRDAYPVWVMTGAMLSRYAQGHFPRLIPALERAPPMVVMVNRRTSALPEEERRFLAAHYVHHDGPIFVHGAAVGALTPGDEVVIRVLRTTRFRWEGEDGLLVDGLPFREGELAAGEHRLAAARALAGGRLAPARATRLVPPRPPFELYPQFD